MNVFFIQLAIGFYALCCSAPALILIMDDRPWWGGGAAIIGAIAFFWVDIRVGTKDKAVKENKCPHPDWYSDHEYGTVFCRECHAEIPKDVVQARRDVVAKEVKESVLRDIAAKKSGGRRQS